MSKLLNYEYFAYRIIVSDFGDQLKVSVRVRLHLSAGGVFLLLREFLLSLRHPRALSFSQGHAATLSAQIMTKLAEYTQLLPS